MSKSDILISIIVPVYNREKTLPALMETILPVESRRLEVILVNDGSSDGSLELCRKIAEQDERVSVVDKANGGVSSARNAGLAVASGKYVFFCDGDDLVVPETLKTALVYSENHTEDLLIFDFQYNFLDQNRIQKSSFVLPSDKVLEKNDIVDLIIEPMLCKEGTDFAGIWHKLFKNEKLKSSNVLFEEKVAKGEDWRFILDFLDVCDTAFYIPNVLYTYNLDGSQEPSKYKRIPGIHQLGSIERRLRLIKKHNLTLPDEKIFRIYKSYLPEIAYAAANECPRGELAEMVKNSGVQKAVRVLLKLSKEQKNQIEFFRRELIFALCIRFRWISLLKFVSTKIQLS